MADKQQQKTYQTAIPIPVKVDKPRWQRLTWERGTPDHKHERSCWDAVHGEWLCWCGAKA